MCSTVSCRLARGPMLLAMLLAAFSPARASDTANDLAGIDAVTVGISQITPDGVQCGLDPARLLQAARQTLDNAGIAIRDDAASRLTVSTVTTRDPATPDICATATMVGAYRRESFVSSGSGWLTNGYVVLWQRSLVTMTSVATHPSAVAGAIRRVVAQFVADRDLQRLAAQATSKDAKAAPAK